MPESEFKFSPRVALVFQHLDAVRDVLNVCGEKGEFGTEMKTFAKRLMKELLREIPTLQSWIWGTSEKNIYVHRGSRWKIEDSPAKEAVSICVSFDGLPNEDPGVGLLLPESWSQEQQEAFNSKLFAAIPSELKTLRCDDEWVEWPLWQYAPMKGDVNDAAILGAFATEIKRLVTSFAGLSPQIEGIVSDLREPSRKKEIA